MAEIQDEFGAIAVHVLPRTVTVRQLELVDFLNGVLETLAPTPAPTTSGPGSNSTLSTTTDSGGTTTDMAPTTTVGLAPTPVPTAARNFLLDVFVNNTLTRALEDISVVIEPADPNATLTDANATLIAEQAFVEAYREISTVSSILNDIQENVSSVSVEQLSDLRADAFDTLTDVLNPLANATGTGANSTGITDGVVTLALQLMVDLSVPETQLSTDLRGGLIDTAAELLNVDTVSTDGTDVFENGADGSELDLNTASLVISLIGELSETSHTGDTAEQNDFATKVSSTVADVANGISASLVPGQRAVEVDTAKLGLYVKVESTVDYEASHYFQGFNASFPRSMFDKSNASAVGLSLLVSTHAFHPLESNAAQQLTRKQNVIDERIDPGDVFEVYESAVASMPSISTTVRVEFTDQSAPGEDDDIAFHKRGSEIVVDNLDPCEPILLHIPISEEFRGLNFSKHTPVCRHRDESSGRALSNCVPDPDNLELLKQGKVAYLACRCTHLTFFDAGWSDFIPSFNELTEEDFRDFTFENVMRHPTGAYVTGGLFGTFVLLLLWGVYLDNYTLARTRGDESGKGRVAFFNDSAILRHLISRKLEIENRFIRVAYGVWIHTLKNYHRWTALFLRDRHSSFLSKDRAVVIYAFVMSTLAMSAVFYGQQTAQSFLLTALISALAAGLPAYFFKWLFCRCRISNDQLEVNQYNLDHALNTSKALTFVDALDVIERDRNHGWGRFAFTQRAVTRVRARVERIRTGEAYPGGGHHYRTPVDEVAEQACANETLRPRRDSEASFWDDLSDDAVFEYVWDIGLPMGDAFDFQDSESEWSSEDDEEHGDKKDDGPTAYESEDDSDSVREEKGEECRRAESELEMGSRQKVRELKSSRAAASNEHSSKSSPALCHVESSDSLMSDSLSCGSVAKLQTAADQYPSVEEITSGKPNSTLKTIRHALMSPFKSLRTFFRSIPTEKEDGYDASTQSVSEAEQNTANHTEPSIGVDHTSVQSSEPPSTRTRKKKRRRRRAQSVSLKSANSRIRALQRNLTTSRTASRETLARVLRPPRSSLDAKTPSPARKLSQHLNEDARFHSLMLPTDELQGSVSQPTTPRASSASPMPDREASGNLTASELATNAGNHSALSPGKSAISRRHTMPLRGEGSLKIITDVASAEFLLRSTGRPHPWALELNGEDEVKGEDDGEDEGEDSDESVSILPGASPTVAQAKDAFEELERSVSVSQYRYRSGSVGTRVDDVLPAGEISLEMTPMAGKPSQESPTSADISTLSVRTPVASQPSVAKNIVIRLPSSYGDSEALPEDENGRSPGLSRRILSSFSSSLLRLRHISRRRRGKQSDPREDGGFPRQRGMRRASWPPWVRWVVFALAMLWALGCTMIILLFSLQFDLTSDETSYYDAYTCPNDLPAKPEAVTTTDQWMRSIAASSALDVFAIQPVLLLLFAMAKIQWENRKRRRLAPLKRQFSSLAS